MPHAFTSILVFGCLLSAYFLNWLLFILSDSKVTVSLRYADLVSTLPSGISVLAWPMQQPKKLRTAVAPINRKEALGNQLIPARLAHAEDALRSMSLPEGWTDISESRELSQCYQLASCFLLCQIPPPFPTHPPKHSSIYTCLTHIHLWLHSLATNGAFSLQLLQTLFWACPKLLKKYFPIRMPSSHVFPPERMHIVKDDTWVNRMFTILEIVKLPPRS